MKTLRMLKGFREDGIGEAKKGERGREAEGSVPNFEIPHRRGGKCLLSRPKCKLLVMDMIYTFRY